MMIDPDALDEWYDGSNPDEEYDRQVDLAIEMEDAR
jgi:hypothetical protein